MGFYTWWDSVLGLIDEQETKQAYNQDPTKHNANRGKATVKEWQKGPAGTQSERSSHASQGQSSPGQGTQEDI